MVEGRGQVTKGGSDSAVGLYQKNFIAFQTQRRWSHDSGTAMGAGAYFLTNPFETFLISTIPDLPPRRHTTTYSCIQLLPYHPRPALCV